jgi:hypothetical protein
MQQVEDPSNIQQPSKIIPFWYVFTTITVAVGAISNQTILQFVTDFDFELQQLHLHVDIGAAPFTYNARPIPNETLLLVDSSSGQQFSNAAIPVDMITGDGEHPYFLPQTIVFKGGTSLSATIANYDTTNAYNNRLVLIGRALFYD